MAAVEGVEIAVDAEAVVVTSEAPLSVLSSAVAGGGLGPARCLVNLHVSRGCPWQEAEARLGPFVARRRLPSPRPPRRRSRSRRPTGSRSSRCAGIR